MFEDDTTNGRRVRAEPPAARQRQTEPCGRTAQFVAAFTRRYGVPFAKSWLSGRTCQFEDGVIWTGSFPACWLRENCGDLLGQHRVVVRHDADSRAHFDAGTAEFAKAKGKGKGR